MNTQRWIAVAMLGVLVLVVVSSPVWIVRLREDAAEEAPEGTAQPDERTTDTPDATMQASAAVTEEAGAGPVTMEDEEQEAALGPELLNTGLFVDGAPGHHGQGTASIYEMPNGSRALVLDPFEVTEGAHLHVIMAASPDPRSREDVLGSPYLDLGELKSDTGPQTYELPPEVALEQYKSVVIYSAAFDVIFSYASLE
jgi:hypothetical protein